MSPREHESQPPYHALRLAVVCGDRGIAATGQGGAAHHLRSLCGGFMGLGIAVQLWCQRFAMGGNSPPAALPPGLVALQGPKGRLPGMLRKHPAWDHGVDARAMARWAIPQGRRFRPDLIYERFSLFSSPGRGVARDLRVPYVVELNAPLAWESALFRGMPASSSLLKVESRSLSRADLVVCVSPAIADYALRRGVLAERILVQPNGAVANENRIDGSLPDAAAAIEHTVGRSQHVGLPQAHDTGSFVLGYAGSFKAWQGLPGHLGQLRGLGAKVAPQLLHLDLWGDGPDRQRFTDAICNENGISFTWNGWGTASQLGHARAGWDAAWVPLAPWPPTESTDGRSLESLQREFRESVPALYFSPLKAAEASMAGVAIWPNPVGPVDQRDPLTWVAVAQRILGAVDFPPLRPRGKMHRALSGSPQATL